MHGQLHHESSTREAVLLRFHLKRQMQITICTKAVYVATMLLFRKVSLTFKCKIINNGMESHEHLSKNWSRFRRGFVEVSSRFRRGWKCLKTVVLQCFLLRRVLSVEVSSRFRRDLYFNVLVSPMGPPVRKVWREAYMKPPIAVFHLRTADGCPIIASFPPGDLGTVT